VVLGRIIHAGNGDRRFFNNAHGDDDEVGTYLLWDSLTDSLVGYGRAGNKLVRLFF